MTGIDRGSGGASGPPWSVDLLADLHAGALDPDEAARLWPRVNADAEAQAVLAALDATQTDLRGFASAPVDPMPAHFAARLDAAIAAEAQARTQASVPAQRTPQATPPASASAPPQPPPGHAPVVDLAEARKRRNRRLGWAGGILTAAAAAVAIAVVSTGGGGGGSDGPPVAGQTPTATSGGGPLAFRSTEMGKPQLDAAKGQNDLGPLQDPQKLSACLTANGISPKAEPIGSRQVTVDGKAGVLLVLVHGPGEFRLVAVGTDCGPGNPALLADKNVK